MFIQFTHSPQPEDLENFDKDGLSLDQSVQRLATELEPEDSNDPNLEISALNDQEEEGGSTQNIAKWNPDRLVPNVLVDAIQLSGERGLSNWVGQHNFLGQRGF